MPLSSKEMMAQFDGHFENLASATTNSGAALDQIAATTTTQYSDIKSLLTSLKAAAINGSHSAAAATSTNPQPHKNNSRSASSNLRLPCAKTGIAVPFAPSMGGV